MAGASPVTVKTSFFLMAARKDGKPGRGIRSGRTSHHRRKAPLWGAVGGRLFDREAAKYQSGTDARA